MASVKSMDLTQGSVLKKLLLFTVPIFLTSFMQQLYHSADIFVVGNFAGTEEECKNALAAVGATGSVTSLLLNAFLGISVGANVLYAQAMGRGDRPGGQRVISTSVIFSFSSGVFLALVGYFFTPALLHLIQVPAEIFDEAVMYMRIIFFGQPASLLFNFCASIFRAGGNTRSPMQILMATGLVNVLLNLLFVIVFRLDSAGVAIATVVSNYLSAIACLAILFHPSGEYGLSLSNLRLFKDEFAGIIKIGLPAGLNSILFQFSNTIVATAANSLGTVVVAAVSASSSVNNVAHTFGSALDSATISFAGQNCGAGKLRRVDSLLWRSLLLGQAAFLVINTALTIFPRFFLGIFTSSAEVIEAGIPKLMISSWGYMFYLAGEIVNACHRGLGKSIRPTLINIFCVCFIRVAWVWFIFPLAPADANAVTQILWLYMCLPVSWFCSAAAQSVNYFFVRRGVWKKKAQEGTICPEDMAYYLKKKKNRENRNKIKKQVQAS